MSSEKPNQPTLGRRPFMKAAGLAAGAGVLGFTSGNAAAAGGIDDRLLNWRRVEAEKVWARGFRGRPDRSVGIIDTGIARRHPDVGPWNGVQAIIEDGNVRLVDPEASDVEIVTVHSVERFREGSAGPGTFVTGEEVTTAPFVPRDVSGSDADTMLLDAELHWTPYEDNANDLEFRLDRKTGDGEWTAVKTIATAGMPETMANVGINPDATYRFVADHYKNVQCDFWVNVTFKEEVGKFVAADDPFAFLDSGTETPIPKTVGWFRPGTRFGTSNVPVDPNGHGSHCASIATGTGRASTIDPANTQKHEPRTVLLPGDFVEYTVTVNADASVFASALGENIRVEIVHDAEVVHESYLRLDSIIVDEPAVHDAGTAEYTIRVRPWETNSAGGAAQDAQAGNPTTGRLKEIAVGSYVPPTEEPVGARRPNDRQVVHPGLAPDTSLVGLQGFGTPTVALGDHAEAFADAFNLRAVNMSFGYPFGLPLGMAGGLLDDLPAAVRKITDAGILPVAAAGNFMTPANGNGSPAGMDEAVSVVATGPLDGITAYSAGGVGSVDEDDQSFDKKPDVTAPGGDADDYAVLFATAVADANTPLDVGYPIPSYLELVRAAHAPDPNANFPAGDPPRDYDNKGGTSMASPYVCGTSSLLAQAMEEAAPDSIALPAPADAGKDDAFRLKQVLLATATETAFTAAPYHTAKSPPHAPVYTHGGRDPYEGFGRVNPDAAVDAVTRPFVAPDDDALIDAADVAPGASTSAAVEETVGLNIPESSRAVAGYLDLDGGSVEVTVDHVRYSGANRGMAKGAPHLDLFVYDAETPAENGEPNVVTSVQATQGSGTVSVSGSGTYLVVAKLVNVPGVVNGFDVTAHVDLSMAYTAPDLPAFAAGGSRADDGSVFTSGQTNQIDVTVSSISSEVPDDATVEILDYSPWTLAEFGNREASRDDDGWVHLGTTTAGEINAEEDSVTRTYFAEAPSGVGATGRYTFGPAKLVLQADVEGLDGTEAEFGGTDDNVVVGLQS